MALGFHLGPIGLLNKILRTQQKRNIDTTKIGFIISTKVSPRFDKKIQGDSDGDLILPQLAEPL